MPYKSGSWGPEARARGKQRLNYFISRYKARQLEYQTKYNLEHKTERAEYGKRYQQGHTVERMEYNKNYRKQKKLEVLTHYGGNPPKCECCKESNVEFLTIDHMNGGGKEHRKQLRRQGQAFYHWLIKENFPKGYRVLCLNCNFAFGHYGYCPHQKEWGDN